MFNLLNKITWIISITFGFIITKFLAGSYTDYLSIVIFTGFFGGLVKFLFFNSSEIEKAINSIRTIKTPLYEKIEQEAKILAVEPEKTPVDEKIEDMIGIPTEPQTANFLISDMQKVTQKLDNPFEKTTKKHEPSIIESFFKENLLAKIGGILLLLGVLFLMSLIYTYLTAGGKFALGIALGITFYIIGVFLNKKGFAREGLTLMGVGIVVNYLVILSGRYLIKTEIGETFLSSHITFFLLIINSLFSVITSFFYKSEYLLLFSFAIAYLNPLLIGAPNVESPYGLLGYSILITAGAYFVSTVYNKNFDQKLIKYLLYTGFIGGNVLSILAPIETVTNVGFLSKIFATTFTSLTPILIHKSTIQKSELLTYAGVGYVFLFLNVFGFNGGNNYLNDIFPYFGFLVTLTFFTICMIVFGGNSNQEKEFDIGTASLFIPFGFFLFFIIIYGFNIFILPTILLLILGYLGLFSIARGFSNQNQLSMFVVLGLIFAIFNSLFYFDGTVYNSTFNIIITYLTLGIFYIFCLYQSYKPGFSQTYLIGTIGSMAIALPLTQTTPDKAYLSIVALGIFALGNILVPLLNKNINEKGSITSLLGLVIGGAFILFDVYRLSNVLASDINIGYIFSVISFTYIGIGWLYYQNTRPNLGDNESANSHVLYIYGALAITSLAFGVLNIFGTSHQITTAFWFIEGTIAFIIAYLIQSKKVFYFAIGWLIFSLYPLFIYYPTLRIGEYLHVLFLGCIYVSFLGNIFAVQNIKKLSQDDQIVYHILQYILWFILCFGILKVFPSSFEYQNIVLAIFFIPLSFIYSKWSSDFTKMTFPWIFVLALIIHYANIGWGIEDVKKEILNISASCIFAAGAYMYIALLGKRSGPIFWGTIIYLVATSTYYVGDMFNNSFIITLYWGVLFFSLLSIGISQNMQKVRTFGLYILVLLLLKIVFFDIWMELDNSIARVIALMFVGGVMIYISILYSKKGVTNLMKEFSFENFLDIKKIEPKEKQVNITLKKIDVSDIEKISLKTNGEKALQIKGKNFYKIVVMVTNTFGKTSFQAGELTNMYHYILENYQSELSPTMFEQIRKILKNFVDKGGEVKIVKRK